MGVTPFSACQISLGQYMVAMMSTRRLLEQQEIHQHKTGKHVAHNRDCQQSKTSDKRLHLSFRQNTRNPITWSERFPAVVWSDVTVFSLNTIKVPETGADQP